MATHLGQSVAMINWQTCPSADLKQVADHVQKHKSNWKDDARLGCGKACCLKHINGPHLGIGARLSAKTRPGVKTEDECRMY